MPGLGLNRTCGSLISCDSVQDSFSTAVSPLGASTAAPYGVYGNPSLGFGAAPSQASPLGYGSSPGTGPSPVLAGGQIPIYRPSSQVRAAELRLAGSIYMTACIQLTASVGCVEAHVYSGNLRHC